MRAEQRAVRIHPTAIIHTSVKLEPPVEIGPYSVVDAEVTIGKNCKIHAHVHIASYTAIGPRCEIYPFASVGTPPQDLKYDGRRTGTVIGADNVIREFVTINRGSVGGQEITRIGDHNLLMAYSHVAHDCVLGNHVIMANAATLAGHVNVEDFAVLGGLTAVHQYVRIGTHAFVGGKTGVSKDIPPYALAAGDRARLYGINTIGLKRKNFSEEVLRALKDCYRILFRSHKPLRQALAEAERKWGNFAEVRILLDFILGSQRGITR
ncbi:MAG: acyl-ACP--UDP-N-acetylglucosamine O-acyltransferase [Deltaproteobacteria bacterium]|nr:acyl-ACP--UDP-N-acetylglucosamine O-acyltransferase [Deltaproteobacteria bacterium]MBW2069985.1 acyl-ACP--UDP-N-acetylglucosamine O-acyltransferase [Deltaproteobacteria bacterium]